MNERMKVKPANETLRGRILAAMWQNLFPGLILWCIGLALVCSYYFWTETRPTFEKVIQWKVQYGYAYSALSTAFFGGVIPYFYLRWSRFTESPLGIVGPCASESAGDCLSLDAASSIVHACCTTWRS